jgi:PKD repeat protein
LVLIGALALTPYLAVAQTPSLGEDPMTPVIGVSPQSLDFGQVPQGNCRDLELVLTNAVEDPTSLLTIVGLILAPPFSLVDPPSIPFTIPGDGSEVTITVEYCPSILGDQQRSLTIQAARAENNPLIVPLRGIGVPPNLPPSCDAGGPYAGKAGSAIAMSGAGSDDPDGTITSFQWDFGDGQSATGVNPSHAYAQAGTYTVSLTVTDDWGATASCSTTAEVATLNLPPVCDAGGPYSGVVGQPIAFDGSGSSDPDGTIVSYEWEFGDCATGTGANPAHSYANAGTYTPRLCVTDDRGRSSCCQTTVAVSVNRAPITLPFGKIDPERDPTGANPNATLPLHAAPGCDDCSVAPIDCLGNLPTVNVAPNSAVTIYVMAFNYTALAGVQTAFAWDPSWILLGSLFDCLPNQLNAAVPTSPGGPTAGTIATVFDCMTSGQLLVLGRMIMITGSTGCLSQVRSSYPFGTHVLDCSVLVDDIREETRLGKICVGPGGYHACHTLNPVRPATWGQVKATYR